MTTDLIPVAEDHLEPLKGHYKPEIILAGLYALAAHGGNAKSAENILKNIYGDDSPTDRTLARWRSEQFPRRYQHILAEKTPELETLVEHQLVESIRLTGLTQHKILTRLHDTADEINKADLGKTAQQLAVTQAVGIDKFLTITGRPNHITEVRDANEILKALEARYPPPIDATCEETSSTDTDVPQSASV